MPVRGIMEMDMLQSGMVDIQIMGMPIIPTPFTIPTIQWDSSLSCQATPIFILQELTPIPIPILNGMPTLTR